MSDLTSRGPDTRTDPAVAPAPDPLSGVRSADEHYTDPVEAQGVRFAREADGDGPQAGASGDDRVTDDLAPDFLAPVQPS